MLKNLNFPACCYILNFEIMKSPFPQKVYRRNAEVYKIMANPKRLEILNILKKSSCSVEQLCKIIGARKSNISQRLALLRNNRLVEYDHQSKDSGAVPHSQKSFLGMSLLN